jgi:hypothetical protein
VYSVENSLRIDDLWVQVFGSDEAFYWVENDPSALLELDTFSGKMLYGLGLNHELPAETWAQIEISLNELVYDPYFDEHLVEPPPFAYYTGFSLNLAENFEGTLVLDEFTLVTSEGNYSDPKGFSR